MSATNERPSFGYLLRRHRVAAGLTQEELADQQALLRRMSVFSGGFDLESIEVVCLVETAPSQRSADDVEALLASSLLHALEPNGEPRFDILHTIREFAHDRLVESGELEAVAETHARHFSSLVVEAEQSYAARDAPTVWLTRLSLEHDNLLLALEWSLHARNTRMALELGAGLWSFWGSLGFYAEGRRLLAQILALPGADAPGTTLGRVLLGAGILAHGQTDLAAAQTYYLEALVIARQFDDDVTVARALNNLAVVAVNRGDLTAGRALATEGLELAIAAGEHGRQALLQQNLAMISYAECDFPRAGELGRMALRLGEQLQIPAHQARPLHVLGQVAFAEQRYDEAITLIERSLALWRVVGNREMTTRCLADAGRVAGRQRDYERAHELLSSAIRELQTLGDTLGMVRCLEYSGEIAARRFHLAVAMQLVTAASELREALGTPRLPVESMLLEDVMLAMSSAAGGELQPETPLVLSQAVALAIAGTT